MRVRVKLWGLWDIKTEVEAVWLRIEAETDEAGRLGGSACERNMLPQTHSRVHANI